jgi:immune inhibitor A
MKITALLLGALAILASSIAAMPPHERVIQMIESGQIEMPEFMRNPTFFKDKGIDQGSPQKPIALDQPTGQFKAIALLVRFTDHPQQVAATYFDNLIFGTTGNTVNDFYQEVSYGSLDIVTVNLPSSVDWLQMPQTYAYYVNADHGFGTWPQNAQKLTEDAVAAANPYVDFSQYDNDNDGTVDALFVIHTGPGAEYSGSVNDIWSHAWSCFIDPYVDGVWVNGYSMEPEYWTSSGDMTCGVYVHELGHVFGVPDFYDYGYDSRGLGRWSVMAGGSWNGSNGNSPAQFDAYSRVYLGFADAINVTSSLTSVSFPAVEDTGVVYRLWTDGQQGSQYFLVENRQQTGFDTFLPSEGMLIYHVDESVGGNDDQWYPGYTSNGHYQVALEQADGLWDLEHDTDSGDSGDPYPGSTTNRTFNNTSTPDSKDYNANTTYVAVTNISNNGQIMTADLAVVNAPMAPAPTVPANGSATNVRRPLFDFTSPTGATVYHIQIDNDSNFSSPLFNLSNLVSSQYTPTSDLPESVIYWRSRAGNGTNWSPWSASWTVTIDATVPGAPINLLANGANPSPWRNNSIFTISWTNPSDLSGILKAYYKLGSAPATVFDTSGSMPSSPRNITMAVQGGVPMYLWLIDNAGNINHQNRTSVVLNYDATRPTGCVATSPDTINIRNIPVNLSRGNDSGGSGLANIFDVWVRVDNGSWTQIRNDLPDTSFLYSGLHGHNYSFEALNIDIAGNVEIRALVAETATFIDTTIVQYLPGDANNSGSVNGIDVTYLVSYLKGIGPAPDPLLAGDANGSCAVNGIDVTFLVSYLKGQGPAPFRGDCP